MESARGNISRKGRTGQARRFAIVLAAIVLSVVYYRLFYYPFIGMGLVWLFGFGALAFFYRKRWRLILVYLAWGSLAIAMVESFFWIRNHEHLSARVVSGLSKSEVKYSPDLGKAPLPNVVVQAKKVAEGETVYDVRYEIDGDGLRAYPDLEEGESLLFLGGSIAFGEGLSLEETMAYRVANALGMTAYNLGFPGYGPHQMLRSIEIGRLKALVEKPPRAAIFLTFWNHIPRLAGRAPWDTLGPKYVLTESGEVVYSGRFSSSRWVGAVGLVVHELQQKSTTYRSLFGGEDAVSDDEIKLFAEVTKRMANLLEESYPAIDFRVIFIDFDEDIFPDDRIVAKASEALRTRNISATSTRNIYSDYGSNPEKYHLSKYDNHPTALANEEIADYIVKTIGEGALKRRR